MIADLNTASNGATPGPVFLSITETPTLSAIDAIHEEEGEVRRKPDRPSPPISHEMKKESGSFVHTVKRDSDVQICIRASAAGSKNPMRFALRLEEMGDEEEADVDSPPAIAVDVHLSSMEEQLNRIESQMHAMLRDSVYHTKTDAMNKATTFWPIVHVCILMATGFTQANHIVSFFKKRRII
jgi:emp24/gp25L/p24 family/GOLD